MQNVHVTSGVGRPELVKQATVEHRVERGPLHLRRSHHIPNHEARSVKNARRPRLRGVNCSRDGVHARHVVALLGEEDGIVAGAATGIEDSAPLRERPFMDCSHQIGLWTPDGPLGEAEPVRRFEEQISEDVFHAIACLRAPGRQVNPLIY
jgi:hypothetical protein